MIYHLSTLFFFSSRSFNLLLRFEKSVAEVNRLNTEHPEYILSVLMGEKKCLRFIVKTSMVIQKSSMIMNWRHYSMNIDVILKKICKIIRSHSGSNFKAFASSMIYPKSRKLGTTRFEAERRCKTTWISETLIERHTIITILSAKSQ